ncbi:MAG TPA: hypothetical protein VFO54_01925 [Chryseosolibacter sp.]|nr:hypothetical protein [Chryseosolibacter sp.]
MSMLVLVLGIPSLAQNTKGDRPAPTNRETRFKTPKKSKQSRVSRKVRRNDERAGQRVSPAPARAKSGERPGKPVRPLFSKSKPGGQDKPWRGDITKRRIKPRSSAGRANNIYPQPDYMNYSSERLNGLRRSNKNPNVERVRRMQRQERSKARPGRPIRPVWHNTKPQKKEKAWQGDLTGRRIRATGSQRASAPPAGNVRRIGGTPNPARPRGMAAGRISSRRPPGGPSPNNGALSMLGRYSGPDKPRPGNRKIVPRSASAAYLSRRSTNTWANFPRPKRKPERAYTTDLSGKKLRTKNFETQRPIVTNPTLNYRKRIAAGERAYKGPASGGYISRTRSGQRAWRGDIAGYKIRGGKLPKQRARAGKLRGQPPGIGAVGIGKYQGSIKSKQRRGFGNQGEEYSGNIRVGKRRMRDQGESYGGNIKGGKRGFNDQGEEYSGNIKVGKRGFNDQGEEYSGNIKAGKRGFRDQGEEYAGNIKVGKRGFRDQGEEYAGNVKVGKRGFSNQGEEYRGNIKVGKRGFRDQGEEYAGNIKVGKRGFTNQGEEYKGNIKGGKRGFNDQGEEYAGNIKVGKRGFTNQGEEYRGNIRLPRRGFSDQGEEYAGNLKAKRPDKGGGSVSGKLWNNEERPIAVRQPKSRRESDFSGNLKISRNHYTQNPNASREALRGEKASASDEKAGRYSRGVRRNWDYVKNPSSADEAQRTREPGRAFARSGDFQGNVKVQRFDLFGKRDLHPDARFVKLNKNNVPEEKDMLTNFKLWWARLFKKSETQPDHLKEKERTPRYDKGEAGLWYD